MLFAVGENGTVVCIVGVLYGTITVRINSPITMLTKFPCVKVSKIGKHCRGQGRPTYTLFLEEKL